MAVVLKDRVRGWTNAVGEDAFNISADAAGYQAFSVIGDGNQTYYTCFDPNTGAWEVGIGTYTAATNSLSRDTILSSSNSNAKVLFLPNQKELFVGYPAEKAVATDLPATLTSKTIQSSTLDSSPVGSVTPSTGAFTTLTATAASVTSANMAVALVTTGTVTNLTATSASIASANIGTAVITNFVIEGISVNSANFNYAKITDLVATGASIASANATNLQVTGASIASANLGVALITTGTVTNLTATGASVASANVDVALITTGTVTNLTATGASIASANLGNAVITSMTITGASVASVNAGVAVVTDLRVVGASITSANVGNLQVTGASVASANFGNVVTTTERVTNFSATSASIASANAAVALITTGTVTSLTATGASVASANVGTAVITGLTVTNASVASLNAGTATITTGNLNFSSTAQRITGDMSNATLSNRFSLQNSVTNGNSTVNLLPNGTGTVSQFCSYGASDPTNGSFIGMAQIGATESRLQAAASGTGTFCPLVFNTGGSERVRIDTSGNVGIGASPSFLLDVSNTSTAVDYIAGRYISSAAASGESRTWLKVEKASNYGGAIAGYLSQGVGSGLIFGTQNNASTPTEQMRITNAGNVGIGTASPGYLLNVSKAGGSGDVGQLARFTNTSTGNSLGPFHLTIGTANYFAQFPGLVLAGTNGIALAVGDGSDLAAQRKLTIDSSGNVGIGGTAAAYEKLKVGGTYPSGSGFSQAIVAGGTIPSGATTSYVGVYSIPATAAASFTCTSLYHFLAGQQALGAGSAVTNQYGFLAGSDLTGATNNYGFYSNIASGSNRWNFYAAGTAQNYFAGNVLVGTTTNTDTHKVFFFSNANVPILACQSTYSDYATLINFYSAGTVVKGSISGNGSTAVLYNTTSDRRLKTNILPANDASSIVDAIQIVQHDWKVGGHTRYGVVAQDLYEVVPEAIAKGDDGEEVEKTWGVDYSKLVPILVKEIQSLRQRVAELEAK